MLLSVVVVAAAVGEACNSATPCAEGACLRGTCRVECETGLCADPYVCVMMGTEAGPRLVPTCTFERPAASDLKCEVDAECVPLPSQAHTHSCVNKASPAAAFARPEIITTLFDSGAAYRPDDCACFRGVCVDKKDSAVADAMTASATWAARPEAQGGYNARVAVSCFCPPQDYNITVANGAVVSAWDNVASKAVAASAVPARASGVDATFADIARVLASGTVMGGVQMKVTAKFAPEGYPASAAFWPDKARSGPVTDVDWSVRFSDVRAAATSAFPAACQLPQEAGRCRGYFPSWGWVQAEGRCTQFTYGGCGGNDNRFADQASCTAACATAAKGDPAGADGSASAATGGAARRLPVVGFVLGGVAALLLVAAVLGTVYFVVARRRQPRVTFADGDYVTFAHKALPPPIVADEAKVVN